MYTPMMLIQVLYFNLYDATLRTSTCKYAKRIEEEECASSWSALMSSSVPTGSLLPPSRTAEFRTIGCTSRKHRSTSIAVSRRATRSAALIRLRRRLSLPSALASAVAARRQLLCQASLVQSSPSLLFSCLLLLFSSLLVFSISFSLDDN